MKVSISSLIPNAADLLAIEVEEIAGVILVHLNSCGMSSGDSVVQHGRINQDNFHDEMRRSGEYPADSIDEVIRALMEGWAWLVREGLLIKELAAGNSFFISRRSYCQKWCLED